MVNPLDSKAPMSTVPLTMRASPRWSVVTPAGMQGVVARVDGRAAGQQGHRLGRPAVVAQRGQQGVERRRDGAGQVGADPAGAAVGLADQVVRACEADGAVDVGPVSAVFPATIVLVSVAVPVVVQAAAVARRSCR